MGAMDQPSFLFRTLVVRFCLAALRRPSCAAPFARHGALAATAARVTITRDDWGIAHVRGRSDADAVFGAIYAQAEDDFPRIETNYLTALGRTAEAEGEARSGRTCASGSSSTRPNCRRNIAPARPGCAALMDAWADGLNYYLATHPAVRPRVLTRFEPWMALSFTEGSIGGDIERISLSELASFYGGAPVAKTAEELGARPREPRGSNGIAIAPRADPRRPCAAADQPAHEFLLPLRIADDERRGAQRLWRVDLGAVLHLPGVQPARRLDAHLVGRRFGRRICRDDRRRAAARPYYRYGKDAAAARHARRSTIAYRKRRRQHGERGASRSARSHHGPIVARARRQVDRDGADVEAGARRSSKAGCAPRPATLPPTSRWRRGRPISSNATILADAKGEIAYLHPQFVPVRDNRFDYTRAGRRQRSGDRLARAASARQPAAGDQPADRLGR